MKVATTSTVHSIILLLVASTLATYSLAFSNHPRPFALPLKQQHHSFRLRSSLIDNVKTNNNDSSRRRSVLVSGLLLLAGGVVNAPAAFAASDVRATNLELLLPATRVKAYIDQAVSICSSMSIKKETTQDADNILVPLKDFLDHEPTFMTVEEGKMSKQYMEIKTTEAWQKARLKEREALGAEMGIDYTTPYDKFNTAIQQWGDRRQFSILRSRQRRLEESNTIRTALNAYTNNLVFGDAYKLNAQGEEKKALVRNDALPNVNAVVVSDLDLRDLYRNQVLQNMDDARAEIDYQVKSGDINVDEIYTYLKQAQASCDEWFNLIPKSDVEEALKTISNER